ncbi:hypothetical protein JCM4914_36520 [Streptomyces platensis subsp. malvinus]
MAATRESRKRSRSRSGNGNAAWWPVAQQTLEEEVDVPGVGAGLQALVGEMVEDVGVLDAMDGLLAHEDLDVLAQLIVPDQREPLLEDLDEPPLPGRQQQVQHVDDVGGGGLVGYPQQRCPMPVERGPARGDRVVLLEG